MDTAGGGVIIIGGGIIGLSTAYYLAQLQPDLASNHKIHIIDTASELLLSASGQAGGFLAESWFGPASAPLGALSFRLHKELADKHDGSKHWGYAPSTAYSLAIDQRGVGSKKAKGDDWMQEGTSRAEVADPLNEGRDEMPAGEGAMRDEMLNDDGTPAWITRQTNGSLEEIDNGCAQVDPKQLCLWLKHQCEHHGVKIHTKCTATGLVKGEDGTVIGLKIAKDCEVYEKNCQNIVIAAGAWSPSVFSKLFPHSKFKVPISPLAGYSIVVQSPRYSKPILDPARHPADAAAGVSQGVFCAPSPNWSFAPEAFSRIPSHGKPEVWVGGLNDSQMKLPRTADDVKNLQDPEKMEDLRSTTVLLTGLSNEGDDLRVDDLKVLRHGLCFRPVSASGHPIVGRVNDKLLGDVNLAKGGGIYLASGHGPWGISLSLGTGLVLAEMLLDRTISANTSWLTPK